MIFNQASYKLLTEISSDKYLRKVGGETVANLETFNGGIDTTDLEASGEVACNTLVATNDISTDFGDIIASEGTVTGQAGLNGTLLTAAQPNVTSLGTLSSVKVGGGSWSGASPILDVSRPTRNTDAIAAFMSPSNTTSGDTTTVILGTNLGAPRNSGRLRYNYQGNGSTNSTLALGMYGHNDAVTIKGESAGVNKTPSYTLDVGGTCNLDNGNTYKIGGTDVLSATTLGGNVVNSSLTSLGTVVNFRGSGDAMISSTGSLYISNGATVDATQKLRFHQSGTSAYCDWTGDGLLHFRHGAAVDEKFTFNGSTGDFSCTSVTANLTGKVVGNGVALGNANVVAGTNLGGTDYNGGPYIRTGSPAGWDSSSTSHTISYADFAFNSSNDNLCGKMFVYAAVKASNKVGIVTLDIIKASGSYTSVVVSSVNKTANFTTLTAASTGTDDNILVTTDGGARVSWTYFGTV
jgi:hypothetical protein